MSKLCINHFDHYDMIIIDLYNVLWLLNLLNFITGGWHKFYSSTFPVRFITCIVNVHVICVSFLFRLSDESGKMVFKKVNEGSFPRSMFDSKDGKNQY